jgi:CheY-like chemotaxis protein
MDILFVDDDEVCREIATRALSRDGHAVTVALDGNEAIGKVRNQAFDLIITDIFMPNKEGLELIQEIRAILPAIKIIAISSAVEVGGSPFLKMSEAFGANTSLPKPFTPAELIAKVREVNKI